ncbi:MAG: hypothetical protein KDD89_08015, partial [Anaerolineales bacterium]|nr:hypothetical protein [Anaerolineales bacterium]
MIKKQPSAPLLTGQRHELRRRGWVSKRNPILRPRPWMLWGALLLSLLFSLSPALAQEPEPAPANTDVAPTSRAHLFVTGSNGERAPTVQLRLYGLAPGGAPLDFNQSPLTILHGDTAVEDITIAGQEEVGTLTLFLVDNP